MSVVRYERNDAEARQRFRTGSTGKSGMPRTAALVAAERLRTRGHQMSAYGCRHCGEWHVGGREKA